MIIKTFVTFFDFLNNPATPHGKKYLNNIKAFFILFFFSMCADYLLDLLSTNNWMINKFKITNIESHAQQIYTDGFWLSLVSLVILAPVVEELLQRSYLTSFVWNNVMVPINIGVIMIFVFQIKGFYLLIFCFLLLISMFIINDKVSNKKSKIKYLKLYSKNYKFYFYLSAISFGAVHIANYRAENFIPILSIFLVLPQIFAGLMLGYIRVSMGLRWSICFHALHNLFFLTFLFINHSGK